MIFINTHRFSDSGSNTLSETYKVKIEADTSGAVKDIQSVQYAIVAVEEANQSAAKKSSRGQLSAMYFNALNGIKKTYDSTGLLIKQLDEMGKLTASDKKKWDELRAVMETDKVTNQRAATAVNPKGSDVVNILKAQINAEKLHDELLDKVRTEQANAEAARQEQAVKTEEMFSQRRADVYRRRTEQQEKFENESAKQRVAMAKEAERQIAAAEKEAEDQRLAAEKEAEATRIKMANRRQAVFERIRADEEKRENESAAQRIAMAKEAERQKALAIKEEQARATKFLKQAKKEDPRSVFKVSSAKAADVKVVGDLQKKIVEPPQLTKWEEFKQKLFDTIPALKALDEATKKFKDDTKDTASETNSFKDALKELGSGDVIGKLQNAFNTLDITRLQYMFRAVKRGTTYLVNAVDKAAEYQESLNLYKMALGEYSDRASVWMEQISDKLMLDPSQLMEYTGGFYNLTKGLGVAKDAAFTMSKNLTQLTYDMASYLNISNEAAQAKIQSAITGQSRAVASAGVAMQVASLQELAYSMGIKKNVSDMTQAEKTYLRYIQLLKSTTHMQGDLARTMSTPANAIRILKQQLELLARSFGEVLIPIVMKAIPVLMGFAIALKEIMKELADLLGFTLTPLDFSIKAESFGFEDIIENENNIDKGAKKAKNSINRMLAPFDDLNVVESLSSKDGNSGSGDDDLIDPSIFDKYIKQYNMLSGYTDELKRKAEAVSKPLKNILKTVGLIYGAFKFGKIISGIGSFLKGLTTVKTGAALLGQTVLQVFGLFATGFSTVSTFKDIVKTATLTNDGFNSSILVATAGVVGLEVAIVAVATAINPLFGLFTGLGLLIGDGIAAYNGYKEAVKELETEEMYLRLQFDTAGIALSDTTKIFDNAFGQYDRYAEKSATLNATLDAAKDSFETAKGAAEDLEFALHFDSFDDIQTAYDTITTTNDNMRDSIIRVNDAEEERELNQIKRLFKESLITEDEYKKRSDTIKKYYDQLDAHTNGYYDELTKIMEEYAKTGDMDTYNKKVEELKQKYSDVSTTVSGTRDQFGSLAEQMSKGISLANMSAEDMTKTIDTLDETHTRYLEKINQQYDIDHQKNIEQLDAVAAQIAAAKEKGETYADLEAQYQTIMATDADLLREKQEAIAVMNATYADILKGVYAELNDNTNDFETEFTDTMNNIHDKLSGLGDVDVSKSVTTFYATYMNEHHKSAGSSELRTAMNEDGELVVEYFTNGILSGVTTQSGKVINDADSLAKYVTEGFANGIKNPDSARDLKTATSEYISNLPDHIKKELDIHSPSGVTEELGMYAALGFANGLYNPLTSVHLLANLLKITSLVKTTLGNIDAPLEINTDLVTPFNSILTKLQQFCNNWRTSINDLVKNTKATLNGITLDNNGKITYTAMPKISVPKFADGGYPTSGDLFFANENGRAEFITSVGNKTAVANQDQMIQALTNAIAIGFSSLSMNNTPSTTIVNIGNKKVYEGQGTYQNRQADRYGTTSTITV